MYLRKKVLRLASKTSFERFPALVRALARDGLGNLSEELAQGDAVTAELEATPTDASRAKSEAAEALRAGSLTFSVLPWLQYI